MVGEVVDVCQVGEVKVRGGRSTGFTLSAARCVVNVPVVLYNTVPYLYRHWSFTVCVLN